MTASPSGNLEITHPALTFLEAMGKDPSATFFRTLGEGQANRSRRGADLYGFNLAALDRDNTRASVYAVIGLADGATGKDKHGRPTGCVTDADVHKVPALFVEWDTRPTDWQVRAWREMGLPEPSLQVLTGGKSVHNYWVLDVPLSAAEWKVHQRRLLTHCEADTSISNPARVMRVPGFWYVSKAGEATGAGAELIHCSDTRYSAAEIEACLPPLLEPTTTTATAAPPRPHRSTTDLPPRTLEQITAAAQCIPRRVGGEGTYESDRNALCGCSAALAEAGSSNPDGEALALLGDRWPDQKAPEQVLRSTTTRNAAAFWRIAGNNGYDLKLQRPRPTLQARDGGLRDEQQLQRPQTDGPVALVLEQGGRQQQEPTTAEAKLALLRQRAAGLLADRAPYAERLPILRAVAEDLEITIRDQELQAMLTAARRARTGSDEAIAPGEWLYVTPTAWLWEGLFMRGCLNLLVAMPKQGKTSLLLAYIAAHHRREPAFLDRTLDGPCPPVLIVGTDQGANDWGRMLEQAGLAERQGDRVQIAPPMVGLHHAGRPLHLDPEGIDRIAAQAQKHPGLLIVVDSLAACVAPLGLKEESAQIADPIHDLMEQVEPHGATVVLIHHASKGHAGEGASMASRGSTALPAVASQTIKLGPASTVSNDSRRLLSTEGRGGAPLSLVIQREGGSWIYIGTAETLQQQQAEAEVQKGLNDRQADALELVRERWEHQMTRTTAADVVEGLAITGKDPGTLALRILKALVRKGFLDSIQTKGGQKTGGRPAYEFWPKSTGEVSDGWRMPALNTSKCQSETSETSKTSLARKDPYWNRSSPLGVSDDSDVSYTYLEE
jgi:hypothetical protein